VAQGPAVAKGQSAAVQFGSRVGQVQQEIHRLAKSGSALEGHVVQSQKLRQYIEYSLIDRFAAKCYKWPF
jgi:hypothetical protein